MKRYFITLFAVLTMTATLSAQRCIKLDELWLYAQTLQVDGSIPLDTAQGLVLERTLTFPDKCQDEIYDVVSNWVETNYDNTPDTLVSITEQTSSNITAIGHIGFLLNEKGNDGIDIKPKLIIEISDGALTVKQHITQYEIWKFKEHGFKIHLLFYRFSRLGSVKTTMMPKISQCYPFIEESFFFKTKEEAIDTLKLCVAYENKIVEEIQSAFKNSK